MASSSQGQRRYDVVVLGGINSDFVVRGDVLPCPGQTVEGHAFYSGPGGKGANQAVAAARLGGRVALIGTVGNDPRGRELLRGLRREHVGVQHIQIHKTAQTGAAIIGVNADGEKQITAALGANRKMTVRQVHAAENLIRSARVLLCNLEVPVNCVLAAARFAAKSRVKVVLDPAPPVDLPKELFPFLFAIRPNSDEAKQITGIRVTNRASARKAGHKLLALGVQICALQAGDQGNLIISNDTEIFLPRLNVKTVDATGAGDAFAAGLACGLAKDLGLAESGRVATVASALSTTKMGAQEALPYWSEVDRILRKGLVRVQS